MLDHVSLSVTDVERSRAFCEEALRPLGLVLVITITPDMKGTPGTALGFGTPERPFFWVGDADDASRGMHVAFSATSHADVRAFHAAALAAGGTDNGQPGPRPHYGPDYYGAFVLDPDGINVEAVCRTGVG